MIQEALRPVPAATVMEHQHKAYQEAMLTLVSLGKQVLTHLVGVVCVIVDATVVDDVPQATNEIPTLRSKVKAR